ncbi:MAG TPA: type 4a pilus biogenesis protein PilO [Gammaproteobacteria bacterium]|jgi:type IV pilus assembly protein PilO|nr:type 4a pilus biogenesis protein PilO [Gammaproteobacteria bacterium]
MALDLNALKNFDINQLRSLDPKNMGSWPLPIRILVLIGIYGGVLLAGYYFLISDQVASRAKLVASEASLKAQFESKALQAANLDTYKQQLDDMQKSFGTMLRQLPGKTELPSILQDISQAAQVDGLKQDLFRPGNEATRDFYAEKPIDLQVDGGFHDFGKFVSDVAALPRIVTLHNIVIKPAAGAGAAGSDNLTMTLTAKTYRYMEDDEQQAAKPKTKAAKKPAGKDKGGEG